MSVTLSTKTYSRLKQALTRKVLANEFQTLLGTPDVPSAKLQAAIIAAVANKAAGKEIIAALQSGSLTPLSGPKNPNAARRWLDALASKAAYSEIAAYL
jgi:hypothetical protein